MEARVAFPTLEEQEEIPTPTRRFTPMETTSGLPDDSREGDERREERRLRDLRGRVKRARAVAACTPGLAETLAGDWRKAARFYARSEITEEMFRQGVTPSMLPGQESGEPPTLFAVAAGLPPTGKGGSRREFIG